MANNLFTKYKENLLFVFGVVIIFCCSLGYQYSKYRDFKSSATYSSNAYVLTVYDDNKTLKLQDSNFIFYTHIYKHDLAYLDKLEIQLLTDNVSFIDFLSGFWTKSMMPQNLHQKHNQLLFELTNKVSSMHQNSHISSFFNALFFGTNLTKYVQIQSINFGILHLIALSGYHLSVIAGIIYFSLGFIYRYYHGKYFPYRNYKYDILIFTSFVLFLYVQLAGFIPSLIRSFAMYLFAIFLMRNNIKILSFYTLGIIITFLIAIFPQLIFSVGFWFSAWGIFYIYLYLHYFSKLNATVSFILFNIWIFFAMNPIVHYFFDMTSLWQLSSPIFTIFFIVFFPLEIILHAINFGGLLDVGIEFFLNIPTVQYAKLTNIFFFVFTIILSILSIYSKKGFYLFNLFLVFFNIWLFI